MTDFEEYLRIDSPKEPCPECGKPLAFSSQFKKMGRQKVQVCRHCKKSWHNGNLVADNVEVGP